MKKLYTALLAAGCLYSCTPFVNYVGQRYPPVKEVNVYVDENAIKRPYTIIGRGYAETGRMFPHDRIQEKIMNAALAAARKNGADAVWFRELLLLNDGVAVSTTSRTDSLPGASVTTSRTVAAPVISRETEILFLKYR